MCKLCIVQTVVKCTQNWWTIEIAHCSHHGQMLMLHICESNGCKYGRTDASAFFWGYSEQMKRLTKVIRIIIVLCIKYINTQCKVVDISCNSMALVAVVVAFFAFILSFDALLLHQWQNPNGHNNLCNPWLFCSSESFGIESTEISLYWEFMMIQA